MYFLINLPAENGYKQQQIKVKITMKTDSLYFVFLKSTLFMKVYAFVDASVLIISTVESITTSYLNYWVLRMLSNLPI